MIDREERMVTSETGGQKASKPAQLGALDPLALLQLAEVAGLGSEKYDYFNFLRGYDWNLSFDAMQRHALLFWAGEDNDPESGRNHMAHVAWHALCLLAFSLRGIGTDNRFRQVNEEITTLQTFDETTVAKFSRFEETDLQPYLDMLEEATREVTGIPVGETKVYTAEGFKPGDKVRVVSKPFWTYTPSGKTTITNYHEDCDREWLANGIEGAVVRVVDEPYGKGCVIVDFDGHEVSAGGGYSVHASCLEPIRE